MIGSSCGEGVAEIRARSEETVAGEEQEGAGSAWSSESWWQLDNQGPHRRVGERDWLLPRPVCNYYSNEPPPDDGFYPIAGEWSFEAADEVESLDAARGGVLVQWSQEASEACCLTLNEAKADDLELEVSMRSLGSHAGGGGLVWRARNAGNHYASVLDAQERRLRIDVVIDGVRRELDSVPVHPAQPGGWETLRVRMEGPRIECWLDGRSVIVLHDETYHEAGWIGLVTPAGARTAFDNLVLRTQ